MNASWDSLGQVVSAVSGFFAIVTFAVEAARQRRADRSAFRPLIGWATALLGALAAAPAAWELRDGGFSLLPPGASPPSLVLSGGLALAVAGTLLAALAPSPDRYEVRELISAVERRIAQAESDDRFDRRHHVELGVRKATAPEDRPRPLAFGAAEVGDPAFLVGKAGTGKTTALRKLVLDECRRSRRSRCPRTIPVYVDTRLVGDIEGPVTVGTIRKHITAVLGFDDPVVAERVGRYLNDSGGRYRWRLAFDIGDELPPARADEYFTAVRQFLEARPGDRALIAVRTTPRSSDRVVRTAAPTRSRRRALLQKRGVPLSTQRGFTKALDLDEDWADVRDDVALLGQLAGHLASTPYRGESRHEMVEALITGQLNRGNSLGADLDTVFANARRVGYQLLEEPDRVFTTSDTAALSLANLARHEGQRFRFRSSSVQAHLAARHLLLHRIEPDLPGVLDGEEWRAVLVSALRTCGDERREALVARLAEVLEVEFARSGRNWAPGAEADLVPGEFRWAPLELHALSVLHRGVAGGRDVVPPALQEKVDLLLRQAIFAGGESARRSAIRLLTLGTGDAQAVVANRIFLDPVWREQRPAVVAQLGEGVEVLARMNRRSRVRVALRITLDGLWTVLDRPTGRVGSHAQELHRMAAGIGRVGLWSAFGLILLGIAVQVQEEGSNAIAALFVLVGAMRMLHTWAAPVLPMRVSISIESAFAWTVLWVGSLTVLATVLGLIGSTARVEGPGVAVHLLQLWFLTWPAAMLVLIALDDVERANQVVPQARVVALLREARVVQRLLARARLELRTGRSGRWTAILVLVVVLVVVAAVDLPLSADVEEEVDNYTWLGALVGFAALFSSDLRVKSVDWAALRDRTGRDADVASLLPVLDAAFRRGRRSATRFLRTVRAAEPGQLRAALPLLSDLERLLEFLNRTLPEDSTTRIREGLWRLAPSFEVPRFRDWATAFDAEHPGSLPKLARAERERDLLSQAIRNSQHTTSDPLEHAG